ncbi:hypothetical protein RND81_06G233400 [Saponaria officinalis]|uniref:Bifunctional inhibitor/plant lipid transfer protein/seed storage helical domain-containing protein n=1 Tax=Saponaria officinalis TaxID=3572 RepID=A0AAW1KE35_SAPOF
MKLVVWLVLIATMVANIAALKEDDQVSKPSCLTNIASSCNIPGDGDSLSQLRRCCLALKEAIDDDRECFCLLKPSFVQDPSGEPAIENVFSFCSIKGSLDSLCPDPYSRFDNASSPIASPPTLDWPISGDEDLSPLASAPGYSSSHDEPISSPLVSPLGFNPIVDGPLFSPAQGNKNNAANKIASKFYLSLTLIFMFALIL